LNNKVLITGATGFIGTNLLNFLKSSFIPYHGLSRSLKSSDISKVSKYTNIEKHITRDQVCVHLAGNNNVNLVDHNEIEIAEYLSNVYGSNLIYLSSSYVYGDEYKKIITETDDINTFSEYAFQKNKCEKIILAKKGVVLRLSNVYGLNMKNNIFHHILNEINMNKSIIRLNKKNDIRDFIHVYDVCSALVLLIKNIHHGLYNISTGISTDISTLCRIFLNNLKFDENKFSIKSESLNKSMIVLDSTKFSKKYLWKPSILLADGVGEWLASYGK
tara:strand:- start:997 stop:1818 length:822 start_codon:yes stop_codon:yes gene_type:complete